MQSDPWTRAFRRSPTVDLSEISQMAQKIIDKGINSRNEASRVIVALREEATRFSRGEGVMRPVTSDLQKILPSPSILPDRRFRIYSSPSSDMALDILPMDLIPYVLDLVEGFLGNDESAGDVLRILGVMGEGKSYAAFVVFLKSLTKAIGRFRLCYIPNPMKMLRYPHLLIEMLLLAFYQDKYEGPSGDGKKEEMDIQTYLTRMYHQYYPRSISSPDESIVQILEKCKKWCARSGNSFVILLDQENELHRKPSAALTPGDIAHLSKSSSVAPHGFVSLLTSGHLAHWTILVSSAMSDDVRMAGGQGIRVEYLPSLPASTRGLTESFLKLLQHSNSVDQQNINDWKDFFYKEYLLNLHPEKRLRRSYDIEVEKWAVFIEKVEKTAFGNPLQTVELFRYFSKMAVSEAEDYPLKDYFSFEDVLFTSHCSLMNALLFNDPLGNLRKAYYFILIFLDYHMYNTKEETEVAAQFFWNQLQGILGRDELYTKVQGIIDARLMVLENGKCPQSSSMLARFILTNLPPDTLGDPGTSDLIFNQPVLKSLSTRIASLAGYFLEYKVSRKIQSPCFQISEIHVHNSAKCQVGPTLLKVIYIRPVVRLYFHPNEIDQDLGQIVRYRNRNRSQWVALIPIIPNCKDIDFALLFLPKDEKSARSPVLFPIQVGVNIMTHDPNDVFFRNDPAVHPKYAAGEDNPVMAAFRKHTLGKGRVQFIWVCKTAKDAVEAKARTSFDPDSWFTSEDSWLCGLSTVTTSDHDEIMADRMIPSMGYECGVPILPLKTKDTRPKASGDEPASSSKTIIRKRPLSAQHSVAKKPKPAMTGRMTSRNQKTSFAKSGEPKPRNNAQQAGAKKPKSPMTGPKTSGKQKTLPAKSGEPKPRSTQRSVAKKLNR